MIVLILLSIRIDIGLRITISFIAKKTIFRKMALIALISNHQFTLPKLENSYPGLLITLLSIRFPMKTFIRYIRKI